MNLTSDMVLNSVAKYFHISPEAIKSKSRKGKCVKARHIVMYYCWGKLGMTQAAAGKVVNRSHCDCIHAIRSINNQMSTSKLFRMTIETLSYHLAFDDCECQIILFDHYQDDHYIKINHSSSWSLYAF